MTILTLARRLLRRCNTAWPHLDDCECEVTHTFTCDRCGKRYGWCLGCHDGMPGACDFCWAKKHGVAA